MGFIDLLCLLSVITLGVLILREYTGDCVVMKNIEIKTGGGTLKHVLNGEVNLYKKTVPTNHENEGFQKFTKSESGGKNG